MPKPTLLPPFDTSAFLAWIEAVVPNPAPSGVVAWCFNLAEPQGGYCVELIGVDAFDPHDEDWATEETWDARPSRYVFAASNWETALDLVSASLAAFLQTTSKSATQLRSSHAVCVGFVDGNLRQVWPKNQE